MLTKTDQYIASPVTIEDLEEVIGSAYQDGELETHVVSNTGKNVTDKNDKIDDDNKDKEKLRAGMSIMKNKRRVKQ